MRKVLLIGGAGYVGSVMAEKLLQGGFQVRVLDSLLYQNSQSPLALFRDSNFEFQFGDMTDSQSLKTALVGATDVVILAGLVGDPICNKFPEEAKQINEIGMQRVISQVLQTDLETAVLVSTCSNYGLIPDNETASEDYALAPLSTYAKAKVEAEKSFLAEAIRGKVEKPVVLRFATAFGMSPRMRFDLTVNEFTKDLFTGLDLEVFDPDTWRPYCHVLDFARLAEIILKADRQLVAHEVFNAGGDSNNCTKRGIIDLLQKYNLQGEVTYVSGGKDARNYRVSFEKARSILGFETSFTIQDGIEELLGAFEKNLYQFENSAHNSLGNFSISRERQK